MLDKNGRTAFWFVGVQGSSWNGGACLDDPESQDKRAAFSTIGRRTMIARASSALAILLMVASPLFAQPKTRPLPEGAEKKAVTIYSDGIKMRGDLYRPKLASKDNRRPAVLFCAGTAGVKSGTPVQMAPYFLDAGFVFLAFDYRGWAKATANSSPSRRFRSRTRRAK